MGQLTGSVLLDTNIAMYAAGRMHALQAPARRVIQAVVDGDLDAYTDTEVLQEILYRYLRTGERSQGYAVFDNFHQLMAGRVLPVTVDDIVRARTLAEAQPLLSPRDYVHWAVMVGHGITTIVTADRHFDGVEGVTRVDPTDFRP